MSSYDILLRPRGDLLETLELLTLEVAATLDGVSKIMTSMADAPDIGDTVFAASKLVDLQSHLLSGANSLIMAARREGASHG